MERIVALCKRRGFIFQSSDIYGGLNGFWDYGPLGVELKRNVKNAWWNDMVAAREDMVGIDCSIIMHPQVWKASGHYDLFCDMMRDCKECKARFRGDFLDRAALWLYPEEPPEGAAAHDIVDKAQPPDRAFLIEPTQNIEDAAPAIKAQLKARKLSWRHVADTNAPIPGATHPFCNANGRWYYVQFGVGPEVDTLEQCPRCGGELTEPREFNLMFESYAGAVKDEENRVFLRPETAQGIFVNFKNVLDSTRIKLPFGIAQIGKSFRNEITPRNYTFRSREFEQMEIEFFCHPSESNRWYEYWRDE
ncbi:MAG: glycine--tRNA ligase, partial [Phycisphaerae bacterium]|nr:glycine--tRNA ligase [Phycisphaerae bacterium]